MSGVDKESFFEAKELNDRLPQISCIDSLKYLNGLENNLRKLKRRKRMQGSIHGRKEVFFFIYHTGNLMYYVIILMPCTLRKKNIEKKNMVDNII